MHDNPKFPSETVEGHGHFVGISEHVGNTMTFKILTSDTNKVIYRSVVRSAESFDRNHRAEMGRKEHHLIDFPDQNITAPDSDDGQSGHDHHSTSPIDEEDGEIEGPKIYNESTHPPKVVTSRYDHTKDGSELPPMPIMNAEDLVGRTFLLDQQEDGKKFRSKIVEAVNAHEDKVQRNPELLRFRFLINND